jgi:peptidoglycan/LPS O-acetylase OafA/YrhL
MADDRSHRDPFAKDVIALCVPTSPLAFTGLAILRGVRNLKRSQVEAALGRRSYESYVIDESFVVATSNEAL